MKVIGLWRIEFNPEKQSVWRSIYDREILWVRICVRWNETDTHCQWQWNLYINFKGKKTRSSPWRLWKIVVIETGISQLMLIQCDSTAFKNVVKHIPFWRVALRICNNIEKTLQGLNQWLLFTNSIVFFKLHTGCMAWKILNLCWNQIILTLFPSPTFSIQQHSLWRSVWGVSCTAYTGIGSSHSHCIHSDTCHY